MKKLIVDCATGEETYVDLTPQEIAEFEENRTKALAEIEAKNQAEAARAALKASAKAKLIAGEPLTAEEADTLIL